ncbi:MAG: transporter substrate-binding domain-containing protein, partial [Angustibacter sp.]
MSTFTARVTSPAALRIPAAGSVRVAGRTIVLALLFTLIHGIAGAVAVAEPRPADPGPSVSVRLGTRNIAPFVMQDGDRRVGFSMDLWREVSARANITTVSTQTSDDVAALLDAVTRKEVDVAVAAISMTAERESRVDFSQSMFSAGLGIAVPTSKAPQG